MTAATHLLIGACGTLLLTRSIDTSLDLWSWVAVIVGSLAPDIDAPRSRINRPGKLLWHIIPRLLVAPLNLVGKVVGFAFSALVSHRGPTHWPLIGGLLVFAGLHFELPYLAWFGWGYLLHIAADFCTADGVPLFGPLWFGKISWSPLRTGGAAERVLFAALLALFCWLGAEAMPPSLRYW